MCTFKIPIRVVNFLRPLDKAATRGPCVFLTYLYEYTIAILIPPRRDILIIVPTSSYITYLGDELPHQTWKLFQNSYT